MPLKLRPPRQGKSPYWSVRGTYLGVYVDRSTKAADRATATRILKAWKDDIERDAVSRPGEPTFLDAVTNYIAATGKDAFLEPITEHFGPTPLRLIDQAKIDAAAIALYPRATPQTRNRNLYTPVSAVLKHAGQDWKIKRPKGWRGSKRTDWMTPDQAFRLFKEAKGVDLEFHALLVTLVYTGMRLSEALRRLTCDRVHLAEGFAYIPTTKNAEPRAVHLPPVVIAALASHPRGMDRRNRDGTGARVFRFTKSGRLYTLLGQAKKAAGGDLNFVTFHVMRHTWATWMRRYAGLDLHGLVQTQAWSDPASAARYAHVVASEESRRADLLPVDNPGKSTGERRKPKGNKVA